MKIVKSDILIIGGGLTGLSLAYFLKEKDISITIVESRERLGGRIFTKYEDNRAPIEMGATWLGKKHSELIKLLGALDIEIFEQILGKHAIYEPISTSPPQLVTLPPNEEPSYRIKGGTSVLINRLAEKSTAKIYTKQTINSITKVKKQVSAKSDTHDFQASVVVSTLPPYLFQKSIKVIPPLPHSFTEITKKTHTWMGESIKIGLSYKQPFWRKNNLSGTIFSNVGPIPEMYDHSNYEASYFALKGFLNSAYFSLKKEERLALILKQLSKYFGSQVQDFIAYEETIWRNEPFTFSNYPTHVLPHQNNGHAIFQQSFLDNQLFIAGSETANNFPGYMEGAVRSAGFIYKHLENNSKI